MEGSRVTLAAVVLLLCGDCEVDLSRARKDDGERAISTGVNPIGEDVRLLLMASTFEGDEAPATLMESKTSEFADKGSLGDASPMTAALAFPLLLFGRTEEKDSGTRWSETSWLVYVSSCVNRDGAGSIGACCSTGDCAVGACIGASTDNGDMGSESCIACIAKDVSNIF